MAVIVQTDAGDVEGANAYISVADFKAYHDARGNSYVGKSDDQIGQAIVRATDYIDARFAFRGIVLLAAQTTRWPRQANTSNGIGFWDIQFPAPDIVVPFTDVVLLLDSSGNDIVGIPKAVKNATAEYAFRALSIMLFQDAPAPEGGRAIQTHTVKVDVIEETITYEPGAMGGFSGSFVMPAFPAADLMLARAGLIETGRTLYR